MGGSALSFKTRRVETGEYLALTNSIANKLSFKGVEAKLVQAYRSKKDFGDADFVVVSETLPNISAKEFIQQTFIPSEIVQNSKFYSFDINNFQIDFILHSKKIFDIACNYYNWSPSGNAIGKLYHQFKLRLGHTGLFYTIREEDIDPNCKNIVSGSNILENVVLSTDWKEICELIGLNYYIWVIGFDDEEDIFEWISSSFYFHPNRFSFEEMNHRARTRDRKRPDYKRLMRWIEKNQIRLPKYQKLENKRDYLPWLMEIFPILKIKFEENKEKFEIHKITRSKFNGDIAREITGLEDRELGKFITSFKIFMKNCENTSWDEYVLRRSSEEIRRDIKDFYKKV